MLMFSEGIIIFRTFNIIAEINSSEEIILFIIIG